MASDLADSASGDPTGGEHAPSAASEVVELVSLADRLGRIVIARGLTLATAESCTGGLVGHVLTEIAGASAYYVGGVVSYSDALKRDFLDVAAEVLERHGAVSAQAAIAMAEGARARTGADIAIAVTGIAGPTGGSAAKPVGLTYVALADAHGHDVRRHVWHGDREQNKRESARAALTLVVERVSAAPDSTPPRSSEGAPPS